MQQDHEPSHDLNPDTCILAHGTTLVIPHPHSRCLPYIISAIPASTARRSATLPPEDLDRSSSMAPSQDDIVENVTSKVPPWYPFGTLEDFEQVELFVEYNATDPQINRQLDLITRASNDCSLTIKSAAEIHALLAQAADFEAIDEVCLQLSQLSSNDLNYLV